MIRCPRTIVAMFGLSLFGLTATLALAREGESDTPVLMPEREVSASRLQVRLDEVAASTERIDRGQIEALQPASTAEIFRALTGVQVDGGGTGPAYLHLRGADPNLTLILIDGVAVNDPTDARGGSFDLRNLDPSEIERIEVVRGPASAVHGSDALAGVVQIITRRARNQAWSRAEFGDFDRRAWVGGLGGGNEKVQWDLRAHHREGGQEIAGQEHRTRGAGAKGRMQLGAESELRWNFQALSSQETRYRDDSGGVDYAATDDLESEDGERAQFATEVETPIGLGETTRMTLRVSTLGLDRSLDSPAIAPGVRGGVPATTNVDHLRRSDVGADLNWHDDNQRLVLGVEGEFEDGRSRGTLDQGFLIPTNFDRYRRTGSAYLEASHTTARAITIEGALRWDAILDLQPQLSPRLGVSWRLPRGGVRLHASGARGYKAPSFFAVAHPLVGNPGLDPESSESYEFGVAGDWGEGRFRTNLTVFRTDYTDLIDFDGTIFRMVNRDVVDARGIEVQLQSRLNEAWSVGGQWTYTTTEVQETGASLLDRPQWTASLDVDWRLRERAQIRLRAFYQGAVPDSSIPTGDRERKEFLRLDLSASSRIVAGFSVEAAVENVLDKDYEEAIGLPGRGRFARMGIRVQR
jgi:vitamin B12 transporter